MELPIPFAPGYFVTDDGRVYSERRGGRRELRPRYNVYGYPRAAIYAGGRTVDMRVHRLVAVLFVGAPPTPEHEVRHLDGNPRNCSAGNLAWGTHAENMADMARHFRTGVKARDNRNYPRGDDNPSRRLRERMARGEKVHGAKLTGPGVVSIRARLAGGATCSELASEYGVTFGAIYAIKVGRNWKHVAAGASKP